MILFIKHIDIEGPETLGRFFDNKGYTSETIALYEGQEFPEHLDDVEAVIVLGGPMNVYEEDKYPFLKKEDIFIKKVIKEGIPYLGICLGSQLLAKACQSPVHKSPQKEVGFSQITITAQGLNDPLFSGLSSELEVFQWHEDMFHIPDFGSLLATSKECTHQAFKVGRYAYGLQCHVEITDRSIKDWCDSYFDLKKKELLHKKEKILKDYSDLRDIFNKNADTIYKNFLSIMKGK
jgi:GMP synthase-like glutamine amidotransferase